MKIINQYLNKKINLKDGRMESRKTIILNIGSYLLITGLFTYMLINSFLKGQWILGILLTPINIILWAIPFARKQMEQRLMTAIMKR